MFFTAFRLETPPPMITDLFVRLSHAKKLPEFPVHNSTDEHPWPSELYYGSELCFRKHIMKEVLRQGILCVRVVVQAAYL